MTRARGRYSGATDSSKYLRWKNDVLVPTLKMRLVPSMS